MEGRQGRKIALGNLFYLVRAATPVLFVALSCLRPLFFSLLWNSVEISVYISFDFATMAWVTSLGINSRSGPDGLRIYFGVEELRMNGLRFWAY